MFRGGPAGYMVAQPCLVVAQPAIWWFRVGPAALIKISLLKGRVLTNTSALPVQRQVLEQLFITDPKVAFGHASLL